MKIRYLDTDNDDKFIVFSLTQIEESGLSQGRFIFAGQYAGFCDEKGTEVFENDVIVIKEIERSAMFPDLYGSELHIIKRNDPFGCVPNYSKTLDPSTIELVGNVYKKDALCNNIYDLLIRNPSCTISSDILEITREVSKTKKGK